MIVCVREYLCGCVHGCVHVHQILCISALLFFFHACKGESPYCRVLDQDQHTFQVIPTGCAGNAKTLLRRVEVPAETCVRPFSIN